MIWDNPFFLRHFRSQFRPGKIIVVLACYLLVVGIIGVTVWARYNHQAERLQRAQFQYEESDFRMESFRGTPIGEIGQPEKAQAEIRAQYERRLLKRRAELYNEHVNYFFLALVYLQASVMFVVGGLMASFSTAQEITRKTWEFTQTASYPPRSKVLGDVFGRAILPNATILLFLPLAGLCFLLDGVSMGRILRVTLWLACGGAFFSALGVSTALLQKRISTAALGVLAFSGAILFISGGWYASPAAWVAISPRCAIFDSDAGNLVANWAYRSYNNPNILPDFFTLHFDSAYLGIGLYGLMTLLLLYIIHNNMMTYPRNGLPRLAPIFGFLVIILAIAGSAWSDDSRSLQEAVFGAGIIAAMACFSLACAQAPNREQVFDNIWRYNPHRYNVLSWTFSERSSPTVFLAFMFCYITAVVVCLEGFHRTQFVIREPFAEVGGPLLVAFFFALQYCEMDQYFVLLLGKAGHALTIFSGMAVLITGGIINDRYIAAILNPLRGADRGGRYLVISLVSTICGTVLFFYLRQRHQVRLKREMAVVVANLENDLKEFSTLATRKT